MKHFYYVHDYGKSLQKANVKQVQAESPKQAVEIATGKKVRRVYKDEERIHRKIWVCQADNTGSYWYDEEQN